MAEKRPIIVLTSTFPRWDRDTEPPFVFELTRRLTAEFQPHVLAPHTPGAKQTEDLDGVNVHRFRYAPERLEQLAYEGGVLARLREKRWRYLLVAPFLIAELVGLVRLIRRTRPVAIHVHWIIPHGLVALLARFLARRKVPLLVTAHGGDLFSFRGRFGRFLKRVVLERADACSVVSEAMLRTAMALGRNIRASVIPMGVDLQETFTPGPCPGGEFDLLFVGRLVPKKGAITLIEAMPLVCKAIPGCRLGIAGDGPLRDDLTAMAEERGVPEQIEFLGPVSNSELPSVYRCAKVFVFPSVEDKSGDQEGFGLVAVEAMGCGLPVIASDLPAVRDIVIDGVTGVTVPQADPETLSEQIIRLLSDGERQQFLAQSGRTHVLERFDWKISAEGYCHLLKRIGGDELDSEARRREKTT